MVTIKEYFEEAKNGIANAKEKQRDNIVETASVMGDCMLSNGVVQLFGLNHGLAFSMELGYRAGGLMPFHQIKTRDLALRGVLSEDEINDSVFNNREEVAEMLLNLYCIEDTDMFVLVSQSGCEALIVEVALLVKAKGHKVLAVVSKETQDVSVSTHSSGKKLGDIADLVIDNCTPSLDVVVALDEKISLAQNASIIGNVLAQMITAETYRYLINKGEDAPVLLSANIKGADVHNRKLSDQYLGRWNS